MGNVHYSAKQTEETLLSQNQIATLNRPKKRVIEVVSDQSYEYIYDPLGNKKCRRPILAALAEKRLDENKHQDLVAIRQAAEKDLLSRFLQEHWMFKV